MSQLFKSATHFDDFTVEEEKMIRVLMVMDYCNAFFFFFFFKILSNCRIRSVLIYFFQRVWERKFLSTVYRDIPFSKELLYLCIISSLSLLYKKREREGGGGVHQAWIIKEQLNKKV